MSTEQSDEGPDRDVERRVRVHAALAHPGRLRIVDALLLGDASPGELQHRLGMSSNLLAHHLGALTDAGLLSRHRSEADRRRTYLHLLSDGLQGFLPHGVTPVPRVVFVCTANTARSQLAAALWERATPIPTVSAGTHPASRIAPGATATARRHGLTLAPVPPRHLDEVLRAGDYVITVCDNAYEELGSTTGPSSGASPLARPALHWSVPDPVPHGTRATFDAAYDDLARRVSRLAPRLAAS